MVNYQQYGLDTSDFIKNYRLIRSENTPKQIEVTYISGKIDTIFDVTKETISKLDKMMEDEARTILQEKLNVWEPVYTPNDVFSEYFGEAAITGGMLSVAAVPMLAAFPTENFGVGLIFDAPLVYLFIEAYKKALKVLDAWPTEQEVSDDLVMIEYYFYLRQGCDSWLSNEYYYEGSINDFFALPAIEIQELLEKKKKNVAKIEEEWQATYEREMNVHRAPLEKRLLFQRPKKY